MPEPCPLAQPIAKALTRTSLCSGLRPSLRLPKFVPDECVKGELTADWRAANPELISGENSAEALLQRIKEEREKLKPVKKAKAKATRKKA